MLALLIAGACTAESAGEAEHLQVIGVMSEAVPTVMELGWANTEMADSLSIEWGPTDEYGEVLDLGDGTPGEGVLVGMEPNSEYHWRMAAQIGDRTVATGDHTVHTGSAPRAVPDLEVESTGETTGGFILTSMLSNEAYSTLYDHNGKPVWWAAPPEGNFVTESRVALDGSGVDFQSWHKEEAHLLAVNWDGTQVLDTPTPGGHHDFDLLPDGSYAYCWSDKRTATLDGVEFDVVGDTIVELQPGADAASAKPVWSAWDSLPVRAAPAGDSGFYEGALDWTHCDSLAYEAATGHYMVSMYAIGTVAEVDRESGQMNWAFGGADDQFTLANGSLFTSAHSPAPIDGGLRLFDNREGDPPYSRVVSYELNESTRTATEGESISLGEEYYSQILGDTVLLPDDHMLISWGTMGVITELDADRNVVWKGSTDIGTITGFLRDVPTAGGRIR